MEYEIKSKPLMLQETVAMLYKYVNGISFRDILSRKKFFAGSEVTENMIRRMDRLQQIMEELCGHLNPMDARLQQYFARIDADSEDVCVAQLMTYSFCRLSHPGLRENAEQICRFWAESQKEGKWLTPGSKSTLILSAQPGSPGDLFEQVCHLPYPAESQIVLYRALRNFNETMAELVAITEPLAQQLEAIYRQESWLLEDFAVYWQEVFSKSSPKEIAREILGYGQTPGIPGKTMVQPLLMPCNFVAFGTDQFGQEHYNLLMLGINASANSHLRRRNNDLDGISLILKAVADRRRLEILQRLSNGRSYCHELAEVMEMDSGNMSRHLALLNNYGFLHQEREATINYYETNAQALRDFLHLVESTLLP